MSENYITTLARQGRIDELLQEESRLLDIISEYRELLLSQDINLVLKLRTQNKLEADEAVLNQIRHVQSNLDVILWTNRQ